MKPSSKLTATLLLSLMLAACGSAPKKTDGPTAPAVGQAEAPKPPDKGDPQARFNAALEQLKTKQLQEAEQSLVSLTQDFPQFSGPWTNLGIIYAKSNRKPQAAIAFNKAAVLNQENVVAFNWLGILARETNDYPRAQLAYEKVLKLDPDNALAHYNLAILFDEFLKRPADALPHYREYQRLSGRQDLKVLAWVAEIEASMPKPAPAPVATPSPAPPAAAKPSVRPSDSESKK
jgi:tetratricopeptide (TPR) repeat protein